MRARFARAIIGFCVRERPNMASNFFNLYTHDFARVAVAARAKSWVYRLKKFEAMLGLSRTQNPIIARAKHARMR